LQSFEHISGEPGQPGAKSELLFDMGSMGGYEVVMIETITKRHLPDTFSSTDETDGVVNYQTNRFYRESSHKTC